MDLIERSKCVITEEEDLSLLYSFDNFPIFMGCVEHPEDEDLFSDMNWWISKKSGFIQLNPLIPLDVLYAESHDSGAVGVLWKEHHRRFAEFISNYSCKSVLEIGGAHGLLAGNYKSIFSDTDWTIIEPNPEIDSDVDVEVICGFFDSDFKFTKHVDVVVHSHVLEHVYQPKEFMEDIGKFLEIGSMHIFSVPRLQVMLENGYTNCLNFEHTTYLTEPYIDYLLSVNGFSILEKRYYQDNHSIFYATRKTGNHYLKYLPGNYEGNKEVFDGFINEHLDIVRKIKDKLNRHKGKVYLFGGHIFSQYLIGFGLDITRIECIIDNDPNKQDKRLYGTNLTVKSPKILKGVDDAAVILRAGVYNEEIRNDILANINKTVTFLE